MKKVFYVLIFDIDFCFVKKCKWNLDEIINNLMIIKGSIGSYFSEVVVFVLGEIICF